MGQTLLAILAIMVATLFAFNQQRIMMQTRMQMIDSEVSLQATSVAVDRLEEIGAMAYDDATKGENVISSSSDLTLKNIFTADAPPIDDIDDFDNASVTGFRMYGADTLWFAVESEIHYASEGDLSQEIEDPYTRTKYKKATVLVYSLDFANPDTVRLSQSYSCGSKCDW